MTHPDSTAATKRETAKKLGSRLLYGEQRASEIPPLWNGYTEEDAKQDRYQYWKRTGETVYRKRVYPPSGKPTPTIEWRRNGEIYYPTQEEILQDRKDNGGASLPQALVAIAVVALLCAVILWF